MVVVAQSAGDLLNPSPHLHAIVPRGGWDPDGIWVPVPHVDTEIAERVFRPKVLTFLKDEGLLYGLSPAQRQARRRAWARLIQRVYETSPLTCRKWLPRPLLTQPLRYRRLEPVPESSSHLARRPKPCSEHLPSVARISHQLPAAIDDAPHPAAFSSLGVLSPPTAAQSGRRLAP
ncbi:MAG: hypothetical protein ACC742_09920, partial [Thermoanaerobaculales bacterium]